MNSEQKSICSVQSNTFWLVHALIGRKMIAQTSLLRLFSLLRHYTRCSRETPRTGVYVLYYSAVFCSMGVISSRSMAKLKHDSSEESSMSGDISGIYVAHVAVR